MIVVILNYDCSDSSYIYIYMIVVILNYIHAYIRNYKLDSSIVIQQRTLYLKYLF